MTDSGRTWLLVVVIGGLLYVAGQYVASAPQREQQEVESQREITVTGQGEVVAIPDVARLSVGVQTGVQPTAAQALDLLGRRFTAVVDAVRQFDIEEKDIKTTNVSLQPTYDYLEGRQQLRGFEASESITITIRDLKTVSDVLAETTRQGANQISGVSFEVDDPTAVQADAEGKAIAQARQKAEVLAKQLGVRLGKVKTFTSTGAPVPIPYFAARGEATDQTKLPEVTAPPVVPGSQEVVANVTITYTID